MFHYIVFSVMLILGLLAVVIQANLAEDAHPIIYQVLSQVSSTLLVAGLLSVLYKIFVDSASERKLRVLLRIHDSIDIVGLKEVALDSKVYDFKQFLQNAREIDIVINDGYRWFGNYSAELQNRFSKTGSTRIYLVNPNGKFVEALAEKVAVGLDEYRRKIDSAVEIVKTAYERSDKAGVLEIYYLKNYPTQTLFVSESELIVTPYQTSSGRRVVPVFVYGDNQDERCYLKDVVKDVRASQYEASIHYSSRGVHSG